jgi:glycosyltransferase involved in cell wall biosynthesis
MDNVYIVVPVYNEAPVIRRVIDELHSKFTNVICVNDGSSDSSANEISETSATLVNHHLNLGQGAALQTGISYALLDPGAEYFVTFDADGQHNISDVARMLDALRKENLDIVLGSRFLGRAENISGLKKVVLKLAIQFSNKTSGLKLTDAHNGLRAFNRHVAENLNIENPDFTHASEIVETIASKKFKYKELPVTITYNSYTKSKGQSLFNAVNMGLDILFDKITK